MIVYITIWVILILATFTYNKKNAGCDILYYCIFVCMWIVASGRSENVGVDTATYMSIYNAIGREGYLAYLEPGWNALNIIGHKLGLTFYGFLSIPSFLMLAPIFYLSKRLNANPFWPLLIYFSMHIYLASFNIMRQYVAVSYVLLAYYMYFKGKTKWTIFSALIACSIHYSSILAVCGIAFVKYMRLNREKVFFFFIVSLLIGSLLNNAVLQRISFIYSNYISDDAYRSDGFFAIIMALLVNIFNVVILLFSKKHILHNPWVKLYVLYIVVLNLTYRLQLGARINIIYSIAQLVALPYIARNTNTKQHQFVYTLIFIFITLQFYRLLLANANDIYPYQLTWF